MPPVAEVWENTDEGRLTHVYRCGRMVVALRQEIRRVRNSPVLTVAFPRYMKPIRPQKKRETAFESQSRTYDVCMRAAIEN